jgi:hypothetical protein
MHIVYISDGKAGHRSQALGLYRAMQRQSQADVTFEEISIKQLSIMTLLSASRKQRHQAFDKKPDYIFGVGSHTQLRVFLAGKVFPHAKTVILMKPNLPFSWFDHVIIPEHDGVPEKGNVILTQGALNPIVNEERHQKNRILIALGGSSKRHQWNAEKVLRKIQEIVEHNPNAEMILTTSRRTPSDFLSCLKAKQFSDKVQIFPVEDTPQGWIFEEMQQAEAVWVTEDSVSMVYEALTAGCKVELIEIDRLKSDKITHLIDQLLQVPSMRKLLNEASRVASLLLSK